jgi:DNA-binding transcriptional ArsR family regulator
VDVPLAKSPRSSVSEPMTGQRVQPPMLTNQQLVTAMRHPTRSHAVTVLNERVACAAEIGREIGKPARHVAYHLQQLEKLGVIELVRVESTAGGRTTGKYYRALVRSWYDPESWRQIESKHQPGITADILASCNADLAIAVQSGTIHRVDNHISRTPLLLDPIGYRELVDRLDRLLPEVIEIQQRSAARMTRGDETVLAKVHIIQFLSPDAGGGADPVVTTISDAQPPDLRENDVLLALEHPTRVHALMVLNERAACAAEIGRELGRQADHVTYHLKKLRELGLTELVEIAETRDGRKTGKFYRALIRPWFDLETWKKVDPTRQATITATMLSLCNADIAEAVRSGTINDPDSHISRTPVIVDRESYRDLVVLLDEVVSEILLIQEQSKVRLHHGADRVATKLHLFQFESPDPSST